MDEYQLILLPSNDVQLLIIFFFAFEIFWTITHGPIPIWVYVIPIPNTQVPDLWVYKVYIIHQPYHKS
jgi:hypothetical protein